MSTVAARYASAAAAAVSPPRMVSLSFMIPSLQPLNRGQSSAGMPIISAITIIGRGMAKSSHRSISPRSIVRSTSSRESLWMRGSRSATTRGVNARATRARSLVWRGGSWKRSQSSGWPPGGAARLLHVSWSWSARRTPW